MDYYASVVFVTRLFVIDVTYSTTALVVRYKDTEPRVNEFTLLALSSLANSREGYMQVLII